MSVLDFPNVADLRAAAFRVDEHLNDRHFTNEALERSVLTFARYVLDLADALDAATEIAHAAWHLLDDSGETGEVDGNGLPIHEHTHQDHERVAATLDALEEAGWNPHPVAEGE